MLFERFIYFFTWGSAFAGEPMSLWKALTTSSRSWPGAEKGCRLVHSMGLWWAALSRETLSNPKHFGIHKLEGENLHSELSNVLYISLTWFMESFPRNSVARSVIKACWAARTITDAWDVLRCLGRPASHWSFHTYNVRPPMLPPITGLQKPQFLNWLGNYSYLSMND